MNKLKVSIITICYNAETTISDTMHSVLSQDYDNLEYILVDGGSKDSTLEKIMSFDASRFKVVSEKDDGLYDALNKGISLASGDVIGLLHADDFYPTVNIISKVMQNFADDPVLDAYSGSVEIYKPNSPDKPYRVYKASAFKKWQFRLGIQPPHPGFFIRKSALDKVGFYRTQYKISGDFEWLIRVIWIHHMNVKFSDEIIVHMRDGGLSSSGWKSKVLLNNEILKILKLHGIYSNKLLIYSKYLFKVFQLRSF